MYSCRPGEFSRYVGGQNGFSIFSKALSTVLAPTYPAEKIKEVVVATQAEVNKLIKEYGKKPQHYRIAGEHELDSDYLAHKISDGYLVEGSARGKDAHWTETASESRLWRLAGTQEYSGGALLIEHTRDIVAACEKEWGLADATLPEDPWRDHTYPLRVIACLEMLATSLAQLNLSPLEACALIVAPFVREGVYACAAAKLAEANPLNLSTEVNPAFSRTRRRLEMVHAAYPQLIRKAHRAHNDAASDAIAFWLLHRAITRDPDAWQVLPEGHLSIELAAALKVFQGERNSTNLTRRQLIEFAQCVGCDPARIERGDRTYVLQARLLLGAGAGEQEVREQFLGYLLCIAGWMALDVRVMSDVLADHLGIADPIVPANLLNALRIANWRAVGTGRSVDIECQHPAIDYAIRDLVTRANEVISAVHRRAVEKGGPLECLSTMPSRLGTEMVRPELLDGKAAYEIPHLNFQLAHDEVRELLMGEQLYDQPELAIRELYQNALDACRYRRARLQYLDRTGQLESPDLWQGKIEFEQGKDRKKGRYIECRDNGIGMSRRELESCFARAGKRFCDLPEFIEEQSEWLRCNPPIRMYPNSQFGIGVFSYFMLADELEIETCRMNRKGKPGTRLLITIPGSGSLFRVQELGPGKDAGTRIRLYLRESKRLEKISCVRVLTSILWVAEFPTEAKHGWRRALWSPNDLRPPRGRRKREFYKAPELPIWWTTEKERFLADGIIVEAPRDKGTEKFLSTGIVINMTGEYKPSLTVDRRKARLWDGEWVLESARASVRCLGDWEDLSYMWLWSLLNVFPECEDFLDRELRLRNKVIKFTGKVAGEQPQLNYSYGASHIEKVILDDDKKFSPELTPSYLRERIQPADIGLTMIRVSEVGFKRADAYLWRFVWEAWNWEIDKQRGFYLFSIFESMIDKNLFDFKPGSGDKEKEVLALQIKISDWNEKINNELKIDGLKRLESWQRAGLILPAWLGDALKELKEDGLEKHYWFGLIPRSSQAWMRVRRKALLLILKIKKTPGPALYSLLTSIVLILILFFLLVVSLALAKYVFS